MDIAIIGGGASGMLLASMIDKNFINVSIFEKNSKLGKKLLLTGNGKCNFTSGDFNDLEEIYNNDFAINLYKRFDEISFINYFNSIGIDYRLEIHKGQKYYYPKSNKATSVYYNLLDKIIDNDVKIFYNTNVISIKKENDKFIIKTFDDKIHYFDKIVISTGGMSYKNTGSDGKGYDVAKAFGHSIIDTIPGLTSLKTLDSSIKDLKGVRVDANVSVKSYNITEVGEIQFTEHAISGIPILNISNKINKLLHDGKKIMLVFDFQVDEICLKKRISDIHYKKQSDFLCGILPDELGRLIMEKSGADMDSNVSKINQKLFDRIYQNLTAFEIEIDSYSGFDTAQITIGGVNTDEINNETLESKIVPGLYLMGEVIDINGRCGGYNLQLAYSCARAVCGGIG